MLFGFILIAKSIYICTVFKGCFFTLIYKEFNMSSRPVLYSISSLFFLLFSSIVFAGDHDYLNTDTAVHRSPAPVQTEHAEEGFKAGPFIMDHVTDKYDWHLWGPHDSGVSIPLPVILYSEKSGLDIFLSSKFHHGKEEYNGYALEHGHISRSDEADFYDFSITKTVTEILIASIILLWLFIATARGYARRVGKAPKGLQSFMEPIILFVRDDIAKGSIGPKHYERFVPFLLTIFFFIFVSNVLGLIPLFPGGANVTGNIAVTLTLAAIVLVITLVIGNKHYWTHILWMPGVPAWVKIFLLTPIEIIGVFQRPAVLMIRLFANIAAGHIVILAFICLIFVFSSSGGDAAGWGFSIVSLIFALFMNAMELLVAFLQAYVFTLLTAMYFGSCLEEPHHAEQH